jgi:holo-[acyl-carrier protein] synthase
VNAISTGIDLVEIKRFFDLDPKIRARFLQRVFTESELSETNQSLQHLAGKFAAKEAASKALGCGIGEITWQDLEILNDMEGKPCLHLHQNAEIAAQKAGWQDWSVSISHTHSNAVAVVTALIETPQKSEKPA